MAKLYFRYGAMNSGKSTALMQVAHNYEEYDMRILLMKPAIDSKGGEKLVSRLGVQRRVDVVLTPEMDPFALVKEDMQRNGYLACVLTDESQFFTSAQIDAFYRVVVELGIPVICYGLRTDFLLRGFPGATRLLELAHEIEELKTICTCGRKAVCNARKVDGAFVFEGDQVAIDRENHVEYQSLCAQCYFEEKQAYFAKKQASGAAGQ